MTRAAFVLSAILLTQTGLFYGFSRHEKVPAYRSFDQFPLFLGPWHMVQQGVMEQEVKDVLRADDYINRDYGDNSGRLANLFVAFFKSQRTGATPHSPKNCLPGTGWIWTVSDTIPVTVPGRAAPMNVNRYIVQKGDSKALVLYWYQSRDRVVASEYRAKVYVVLDALRYNRTDTALVRVVVPLGNGVTDQQATDTGIDFVRNFYPTLQSFLPQS